MKLTLALPHSLRHVTWAGAPTEPVARAEAAGDSAAAGTVPAAEAQQREQAAYERGRRDAETQLREQLLAQRRELLELQQGVLTSLQQALPQLVREAHEHLVQLALTAAEKVVAGMPVPAEAIRAAVAEALAQMETTSDVIVQLHPDDCAALGDAPAGVRLQPDPQLARGDCVVKTPFGVVDARRHAKWERLRESLRP